VAQSPGTFSRTGNLIVPRQFHTATLLTNGRVLITGGYSVPPPISGWATAELYDPSTGTFTAAGEMTASRFGHTATLLPDGKVLITGGDSDVNSFGGAQAGAELYDPSTGTFTATGKMTVARSWHTATLLNNGKVLIAGGSRNRPLNSAELYDPSTGAFTATGEMSISQGNHKATLLSNGKVLIESSYGSGDDVDSPGGNELYDPETGVFRPTAGKARPWLFPVTASLLTTGKVLVTEQYSCDGSDLAELYDPSAETSTATGSMTKARGYSTATLLPDGKVLVAGRDWVNFGGGSADLYDPATGTFSTTGATGREEGHTATLLPNGTVLLAGGWLCCGYSIHTAEIYHPAGLVPSPVLSSLSGDGKGPGAILHAGTHEVVSPDNPAVAGETLEIYLTGLTDGSVVPPQVAIGGRMAEVLFFGKAPGFEGLNQVNVRMPGGVTPGSAVPVRLTYLDRPSNEVTIGVR
jgi:hypothetical protein